MKRINLLLSLVATAAIMLSSCGGNASTPKASLKNEVDSVSYAYGVQLATQSGLAQFLEQSGVLVNTENVKYDYQMRIAAADSTDKPALEKEFKAKMDSLNKVNAPKLNGFIKGLKEAFGGSGDQDDAYVQGLSVGNQIANQMMPGFSEMLFADDANQKFNKTQVLSGLIASLKNQPTAIPSSEADQIIERKANAAQAKAEAKQAESLKEQYADNLTAGEEFLAENAKREEVTTLESGLQYEIITAGNGDIPTSSDRVKVHYHGTLIDGTVFDSSVDRGNPASFGVTQVIPGWIEALQLMPVGSKWKLYIPYDLAYGSRDQGTIKPFSTLVFDVELLDIEK